MKVNVKFTIIPFASPLQEALLQTLAQGPILGAELLEIVSRHTTATKQGLYKALRELTQSEVAVKEKKFFSLNKVWLQHIKDFVIESERSLGLLPPSKNRVSLSFRDAHALDIYWGHLFLTLANQFPGKPFFFFNHHPWSIQSRPKSELYLYKIALDIQNPILLTLGVDTATAREFKRTYSRKNIQIAIQEKFKVPKTNHLCIVDDYIITTKFDSVIMSEIHKLFTSVSEFGNREVTFLHQILKTGKKPSITITKNAKKALVWKKRFAASFVIKKSQIHT